MPFVLSTKKKKMGMKKMFMVFQGIVIHVSTTLVAWLSTPTRIISIFVVLSAVPSFVDGCDESEQHSITLCRHRQRCLYTNEPQTFCKDYKKHCCKLCQLIAKNENYFKNQQISKSGRCST